MEKFHNYEFLELVVFDVHCQPKGRLIKGRNMIDSVLKNGMGMHGGLCYHDVQGHVAFHEYFVEKGKLGNQRLCPIPETLTSVMPCAKGSHNVGQVLCNLKRADGSLETTTPRVVAEKQLEALSAMGYSIRSSFELEFCIFHDGMKIEYGQHDTEKPFGHEGCCGCMGVISQHEEVFLDFMAELKECGIYTDTLQAECARGQYELTLEVQDGLRSTDMAAKFKSSAAIFFAKQGLRTSFLATNDIDGAYGSFHFNNSLWSSEGQNIFLDVANPDDLSAIGRQWLAGLIAHTPALTALCCPTVNCYRRLFQPWEPSLADWGKDRRSSCYRLKSEGHCNVYIEARLPSSACNPYLVMAGVVAAGMDGLKRKLSLEEAKCDQELPRGLESALKALEEDEYMVEALGKEFVMLYAYTKRTFEIEQLADSDQCPIDVQMQREKKLYFT